MPFVLTHERRLRIDLLARNRILREQRLIALQVQTRGLQQRFVAGERALGVVERDLIRTRVDLREQVALLDHLAFLEIDVLQDAAQLRQNGHARERRDGAERGQHDRHFALRRRRDMNRLRHVGHAAWTAAAGPAAMRAARARRRRAVRRAPRMPAPQHEAEDQQREDNQRDIAAAMALDDAEAACPACPSGRAGAPPGDFGEAGAAGREVSANAVVVRPSVRSSDWLGSEALRAIVPHRAALAGDCRAIAGRVPGAALADRMTGGLDSGPAAQIHRDATGDASEGGLRGAPGVKAALPGSGRLYRSASRRDCAGAPRQECMILRPRSVTVHPCIFV